MRGPCCSRPLWSLLLPLTREIGTCECILIPVSLEEAHIKSFCNCMHCHNVGRGVVSLGITNYTFLLSVPEKQ